MKARRRQMAKIKFKPREQQFFFARLFFFMKVLFGAGRESS
jgi:hypothetical protein